MKYLKAPRNTLINTALALWVLLFAMHARAQLPKEVLFGGMPSIQAPPYGWTDLCTGQSTGASRHLLEKSVSDLGIKANFQPPIAVARFNWDDVIDNLLAGEFDFAIGIFPAYLADKITLGKQPVTIISGGVMHHTDNNFTFNTLDDLKNKKGVISVRAQYLLGLASIEEMGLDITVIDSIDEVMNQVATKQADYMVVGQYRSRIQSIKMGVKDQLQFSELDEFVRYSYLAVSKGSPLEAVLPQIDKQLKSYTDSGYRKYLRKTYLIYWYQRKNCDTVE